MTDLQDLPATPRTPPRVPDHDAGTPHPGEAGSGESGSAQGGTGASPRPAGSPRWRWIALAAAILAVIALVGMTLIYQGTRSDLDGAQHRIAVLVLAGEADAALLSESTDELAAEGDRADVAESENAATNEAVVAFFGADFGQTIPGIEPAQMECIGEELVAEMGAAGILGSIAAAANDPAAPEMLEVGVAMVGAASACGVSPEVLTGQPAGFSYGDVPDLDALQDACAAGDLASCDLLYWSTAPGSEYERFGATCGDRNPGAENTGACAA